MNLLQYEYPEEKFYPLSIDLMCHNMKITTLTDVLACLKGTGGETIELDEDARIKAK